ncbi:MAG: hypothetical protein ACLP78_00250 [Thermoplasmata archaeon]
MLVLIVVAAAIGFSLFLASEQQRLQSEEAAKQLKNLEGLRVVSITENLFNFSVGYYVSIDFASLDINKMSISGITINDGAVEAFSVLGPRGLGSLQCFLLSTGNPGCLSFVVPALSQVEIGIPYTAVEAPGNSFTLSDSETAQVSFFTTLGNEFTEVFIPPVAEPSLAYVGNSPILDGTNSYEPPSTTTVVNATIVEWNWSVHRIVNSKPMIGDPVNGIYYGQEAELPSPFTVGATYNITLIVTNSFGLAGTATEVYTAPGKYVAPVTNTVTFTETGLPSGRSWSVGLGGLDVSTTKSSIAFAAPNGTYNYSIADVSGWNLTTGTPYRGNITVASAPLGKLLPFVQVKDNVTFSESGLTSGLTFEVTLGGVSHHLTTNGFTDSLYFTIPNGTYHYSITNITGWEQSSLPPSGRIAIYKSAVTATPLIYMLVP